MLIRQDLPPYVNVKLHSYGLYDFMKNVLNQFNKELDFIADKLYSFPPNQPDDLFTIIERTWIGIFNNAIIKTYPFVPTLQEFNVWKEGKAFGRADLMFQWEHQGKKYDIIVEAKNYEWNNRDWQNSNNTFYKPIIEQASQYHQAEYETYGNDVIYMALIFEWMRRAKNSNCIVQAMQIAESYPNDNDQHTHFLSLNIGNNNGVVTYGHFYPIF